jgi:hypothetical protein
MSTTPRQQAWLCHCFGSSWDAPRGLALPPYRVRMTYNKKNVVEELEITGKFERGVALGHAPYHSRTTYRAVLYYLIANLIAK